jgi:hypothetical protein
MDDCAGEVISGIGLAIMVGVLEDGGSQSDKLVCQKKFDINHPSNPEAVKLKKELTRDAIFDDTSVSKKLSKFAPKSVLDTLEYSLISFSYFLFGEVWLEKLTPSGMSSGNVDECTTSGVRH